MTPMFPLTGARMAAILGYSVPSCICNVAVLLMYSSVAENHPSPKKGGVGQQPQNIHNRIQQYYR